MKSLVCIAIFVVIGVILAAPIHDDDVPEWERKHPYCHSCTQTVTELCMLRSHAHCAEFLQVSGQTHIPIECTPPSEATTESFSTTSPGNLPYCQKCINVIKPMCILGEVTKWFSGKEEKHKKCEPFAYMDARSFCSKIGAYSICYVIIDRKKSVNDCLNGTTPEEEKTKTEEKVTCDSEVDICQALQLCEKSS